MKFRIGWSSIKNSGHRNWMHWKFILKNYKPRPTSSSGRIKRLIKSKNMSQEKESSTLSSTADRELIITRQLNAPVELVWKVWTDPDHIKNWWGPNDFTNTISKMDIKAGGEWDLVMHGPDGID